MATPVSAVGVAPKSKESGFRADLPMVLVPVRLETRFGEGPQGPELWVRIYPDQIAVDTHEPELTDQESAAGIAYWNTLWASGTKAPDIENDAWSSLATSFG